MAREARIWLALGQTLWGSPRGRTCCLRLLFFDLNRIGFGFLLLLGTIYFLSSLPPARVGADVGVQYEVRGAMLALLRAGGDDVNWTPSMGFRDHCPPSQNQTFEEGHCTGGLLPRVGVGLTHFGSLEILRRLE